MRNLVLVWEISCGFLHGARRTRLEGKGTTRIRSVERRPTAFIPHWCSWTSLNILGLPLVSGSFDPHEPMCNQFRPASIDFKVLGLVCLDHLICDINQAIGKKNLVWQPTSGGEQHFRSLRRWVGEIRRWAQTGLSLPLPLSPYLSLYISRSLASLCFFLCIKQSITQSMYIYTYIYILFFFISLSLYSCFDCSFSFSSWNSCSRLCLPFSHLVLSLLLFLALSSSLFLWCTFSCSIVFPISVFLLPLLPTCQPQPYAACLPLHLFQPRHQRWVLNFDSVARAAWLASKRKKRR